MGRNSVEFHRNLKNNSLAFAGPFLKRQSGHILDRPLDRPWLVHLLICICFKNCHFAL
jgi:hypothetical protein